jgi:hypothetical protein
VAVTEQVKSLRAKLRECGFNSREFSVRAERKRRSYRDGTRRTYIEFGHASGITVGREVAQRAVEQRFTLADAGLVVQVWEGPSGVAFVTVRETVGDERAGVWRSVGNGGYREKKSKG